jgi:Flp pilus assembly protein TadB
MAKQTKAQKMRAASKAFMSAVRNSKSYNNARKSNMATKKATSSRAIKGVKSRIQAARDLINSNSRRVNNARRTGSAKLNATTGIALLSLLIFAVSIYLHLRFIGI